MATIREQVTIAAPAERVWKVVHEDLRNAKRWSTNLTEASVVGGGRPGPGSRLRYRLDIGGWKETIEIEQDVWEPGRRCAGRFVDGPLAGTWSYVYSTVKAGTRLTWTMDYRLTGMRRLLGNALHRPFAEGIHDSALRLREYVEGGGGAESRPASTGRPPRPPAPRRRAAS